MNLSSGRTAGLFLAAIVGLSACDGGAAPPALAAGEAATEAPTAPAPDVAAANPPANPLAPGWLKLQGASGPVKGRYACQDWAGYTIARVQADTSYGGDVRRSSYFTSEFSITGDGSYLYHGSEPKTGRFAYTPATGEMTWTEGPYASDPGEAATITGIYGVRESDGVPTVVQIFRDPAYGEAAELCFRYKD
jgi:hypothetical protein